MIETDGYLTHDEVFEPEQLPSITFDVHLGRSLKSVDFDYNAYCTYLEQRGLTREQIAATAIHFAINNSSETDGFLSHTGSYIEVQLDLATLSEKAVNLVLVHECQHKIDLDTGKTAWFEKPLNVFIHRLSWGYLVGAGAAVVLAPGGAVGNELARKGTQLSLAVMLGSPPLARLLYVLHPGERRARRAQRTETVQWLSFERLTA